MLVLPPQAQEFWVFSESQSHLLYFGGLSLLSLSACLIDDLALFASAFQMLFVYRLN